MFEDNNYPPPNEDSVKRAAYFYFNDVGFIPTCYDVDFDDDVLGGTAVVISGNEIYIWISFMNNCFDTVVFSINKEIKSFKLNQESISLIKETLINYKTEPFISVMFRKIKSLFA